jgi:hypothetical protein
MLANPALQRLPFLASLGRVFDAEFQVVRPMRGSEADGEQRRIVSDRRR